MNLLALDNRSYGSKLFQLVVFTCIPFLNYELFCLQYDRAPVMDWSYLIIVMLYICFQWLLYVIIPGNVTYGGIQPSGRRYSYKLNSLGCMIITLVGWCLADTLGCWSGDFLIQHAHQLFWPLFIVGQCLAAAAYLKGLYWPTNTDSKSSGDCLVDYISGIELAPRWSFDSVYDLKLFVIGHITMILWPLMNLNFIYYARLHNHNVGLTVLLALLQGVYILDWAVCEQWYLHTIDIKQDRLGYILANLAITSPPILYTSYCWYASSLQSPELMGWQTLISTISFFFFYILFRLTNNQKEEFRKRKGNLRFLGIPLNGIWAEYQDENGCSHNSLLLTSGFWGLSRHFNYFVDLCMCLSLSSMVWHGWSIIPHTYTLMMIFILCARQLRDDEKCRQKYGTAWEVYCLRVPYRIIPGIY